MCPLAGWQGAVFLVNSRLGRCAAPSARSRGVPAHQRWDPFSRSYGVKLSSSLTRVRPSPCVPAHVTTWVGLRYGRPSLPPLAFLGPRPQRHRHGLPLGCAHPLRDRHVATPAPRGAWPTASQRRTCSAWCGHGMSTVSPSPTLGSLGLGPTNPTRTCLASEPLVIRGGGFPPPSCYSCRHSHSPALHPGFPLSFAGQATLPYQTPPNRGASAASAAGFAPPHCRRGATRPVSCYALFQGGLLLSQPPGCLRGATSLPTQPALWGLSWRSGLLPSRRWSLAPTV